MKNTLASCQFAYIDIKVGRSKVKKVLDSGYDIPVTLRGKIVDAFSGDDGVSILFTIDVDSFNLGNRRKKK